MDRIFLFDDELSAHHCDDAGGSARSSASRPSPRRDRALTSAERYLRSREPRQRARSLDDAGGRVLASIDERVDSASGSVTIMYDVASE